MFWNEFVYLRRATEQEKEFRLERRAYLPDYWRAMVTDLEIGHRVYPGDRQWRAFKMGFVGTRHPVFRAMLAAAFVILAGIAMSQEVQTGDQNGVQQRVPYQNMTPEQRAAATRSFLGLGPEPDKAAAARGVPLFQQNCAFCHGPNARGATGSSLITSDVVLGDDHGEHLARFLQNGLPEKGMPAFATMSEAT